jgi:GxxExxY protein
LAETHEQQVMNYLKATQIEVALLLNFGPRPSFKRYLLTNNNKKLSV